MKIQVTMGSVHGHLLFLAVYLVTPPLPGDVATCWVTDLDFYNYIIHSEQTPLNPMVSFVFGSALITKMSDPNIDGSAGPQFADLLSLRQISTAGT